MNFEQKQKLRMLLQQCLSQLDQDTDGNFQDLIFGIRQEIRGLAFQDKLAYTIKELSVKTNISVQQLLRHEKAGRLKTTDPTKGDPEGKGKKIVLRDDVYDFLNWLAGRK